MTGKRLMNISGTEDKLIPYRGGPSKVIPAKDGKLAFVDAEESIFLWARQMGYEGEKLTEPTEVDGKLEIFSYLGGDVITTRSSAKVTARPEPSTNESCSGSSKAAMTIGNSLAGPLPAGQSK